MSQQHIFKVAKELNVGSKQVEATLNLLDEGATVPFISRYRKEMTGSLDEVQVATIRDRVQQLRDLDKRKEAILKSIEEQGKLTEELKAMILQTETMTALEDIYLPYKPKRKTKASAAKEKGYHHVGMSSAKVLFVEDVNNLSNKIKTAQSKGVKILQYSDISV